MSKPVPFTAAECATLRQMRGEGCTWDTIARRLRVDRHRVTAEASRMGLPLGPRRSTAVVEAGARPRGHEALPAGHPITLGVLQQPWVEKAE